MIRKRFGMAVGLCAVLLSVVVAESGVVATKRRSKRTPKYKTAEMKENGTIEGEVVFDSAIPEPKKLSVKAKDAACTSHAIFDERLVVSRDRKVQNAVVSIQGIAEGKPFPPKGKYVLDQKGCVFKPHVVVVPPRQDLTILNSDGILHNLHTRPLKNRESNRAMPGPVKEMKIQFRRPERIPVKCDAHDWMSAWIVVAANPYCVVTNDKGAFRLENVPVGTHTLTLWHESLGKQEQQVTVKSGEVSTVQFMLKKK